MTLEKALRDPSMIKKIPTELPEEIKKFEEFENSSRELLNKIEKIN